MSPSIGNALKRNGVSRPMNSWRRLTGRLASCRHNDQIPWQRLLQSGALSGSTGTASENGFPILKRKCSPLDSITTVVSFAFTI
jgi:hypothetical protein